MMIGAQVVRANSLTGTPMEWPTHSSRHCCVLLHLLVHLHRPFRQEVTRPVSGNGAGHRGVVATHPSLGRGTRETTGSPRSPPPREFRCSKMAGHTAAAGQQESMRTRPPQTWAESVEEAHRRLRVHQAVAAWSPSPRAAKKSPCRCCWLNWHHRCSAVESQAEARRSRAHWRPNCLQLRAGATTTPGM